MKINWMLRLQNKTTLTAVIAAVAAFVYQILGIFGIVPAISQSEIINIAGLTINLLVSIGVVVDPTTSGASDSSAALDYSRPAESGDVTATPANGNGVK